MILNPVISKLSGKLVVLASASPRRLEILTNVGLRFEVVPSWFKETLDKSLFKNPYDYAVETAKQKALEVAQRMPFKHLKTPDIVIGADTVVTVDGLILEKPVDKQDAYRMLSRLSGKEHSVFTGVAIVLCHEGEDSDFKVIDFYEETKVKFSDLSEDLLWDYINSGEPMDKAGGYGIQALGGMLVEYVQGDFLNVVGFPLNHFCKQLDLIYNSPPESPPSELKREDSDETWPLVNSVSKCSENGETEPQGLQNRPDSDSSSAASTQEQNVVGQDCGGGSRESFPNGIADLLDGFKASKTLFTASQLKVFDVLNVAEGLTAEEVAGRLSASVLGTERLLEAATSLELLDRLKRGDATVYRNTEQACQFLVSDSPLSLHGYIQHCNDVVWPLFTHLDSAVREGTNQYERAFGRKSESLFQDGYFSQADVKLRFMKAMHSIAMVTGKDLATAFDLSGFKTACDVGGCTGAMAYAFARAHPTLTVTVFDLAAVIAMRNHFQPQEPDDRVSFVAGDFFKDDLPKADLYILARILHDWSDEKVDLLLRKLSALCTPGCAVLIAETVLDDAKPKASRAYMQSLNMLVQAEGRERSAACYASLLHTHGFTVTRVGRTDNFLDAILALKD